MTTTVTTNNAVPIGKTSIETALSTLSPASGNIVLLTAIGSSVYPTKIVYS